MTLVQLSLACLTKQHQQYVPPGPSFDECECACHEFKERRKQFTTSRHSSPMTRVGINLIKEHSTQGIIEWSRVWAKIY